MRYALYVYSPLLHLTRIRLHPYSLLFINKEAHACSFALHLLYPSILYRKVPYNTIHIHCTTILLINPTEK